MSRWSSSNFITITSCSRHRPELLWTEAIREHNATTCLGCINFEISWKWGPCTSQHLVFNICLFQKQSMSSFYIKLQVVCPKNMSNKWQKYHTCDTYSINCTFMPFPPKAAASASLGQTYPENLKNPISHSGETHFATILGRKPSWTKSNARNKAKLLLGG